MYKHWAKEYSLYDYLQEDLQQIHVQQEQIVQINEQLTELIPQRDQLWQQIQNLETQTQNLITQRHIHDEIIIQIENKKWDNISLIQSQSDEAKQRIEFEIRNEIKQIKIEKNRRIKERNLLYPEKMFTGFRMILEEATNQKWQLTQKIDDLQSKEDQLFDEIARIYGYKSYTEMQLAKNTPTLYQRIQL